MSFSNHKGPKE